MNRFLRLSLALIIFTPFFTAYAVLPYREGSEMFITATGAASYNDNVFLADTAKKNSFVFDEIPGLEIDDNTNADTKGTLTSNEDFVQYASFSHQNTELNHTDFNGNYSDDKLLLDLDAGFNQFAQNTRETVGVAQNGVLVHRDVTNVTPNGEWTLSEKTKLGVGFNYNDDHYKTAGFQSLTVYEVPVNVYYEVAPKLSASAGYRYRSSQIAGNDSTDNYFNVGGRGEFTPKLHGTVNVGYLQRDPSHGSKQAEVGLESNLEYDFSEKTTFRLGASNDFSNAATGGSEKVLSFTGDASSKLSEQFTADLVVSYNETRYAGSIRTDDYVEGTGTISYLYNKYLTFSGSYTYRNNSSTLAGVQFSNNVVSGSVTVRF
jgi:polysaccharide biosynthesis protein VpsM